jgi:hypothetical protein
MQAALCICREGRPAGRTDRYYEGNTCHPKFCKCAQKFTILMKNSGHKTFDCGCTFQWHSTAGKMYEYPHACRVPTSAVRYSRYLRVTALLKCINGRTTVDDGSERIIRIIVLWSRSEPSSETNSSSGGRGIPRSLWRPEVHYCAHRIRELVPVPSQKNPVPFLCADIRTPHSFQPIHAQAPKILFP